MRLDIYSREEADKLGRLNAEDPLPWHYKPIVGHIYRARLSMALGLVGKGIFGKCIEIGYGSGILLRELAKRSGAVYGLDIVDNAAAVNEVVNRYGVYPLLSQGSILDMPYPDKTFDLVVCLSTLEHIQDLDKAFGEIHRVLSDKGVLVMGFPVKNRFMDIGFFLSRIGKQNISHLHVSDHRAIVRSAAKFLVVDQIRRWPWFLPADWCMYMCLRCRKHGAADLKAGPR